MMRTVFLAPVGSNSFSVSGFAHDVSVSVNLELNFKSEVNCDCDCER